MSDKRTASGGGIGFCGALFLLFLGLRLTEYIDWEWYWVASPLWIPLGFALAVISVFGACVGVVHLFDLRARGKRRKAREAREAKVRVS